MGKIYEQLSLRERMKIEFLREQGRSFRAIAAQLGRAPSTISREIRRNTVPTKHWRGSYDGERADLLTARRRRWDARFKLARQPDLREEVRRRLAMGWSPRQIAGRLAQEQARTRISHESIYRFIYHRSAQKDYWHRLLPKAKFQRGRHGRRGGSSVDRIKHRRSIHDRPSVIATRTEPGHWEGDLMLFAQYGQALLVVHERRSRYTLVFRQPSKAAGPVAERLLSLFRSLPPDWRRTITFDNGTEFAEHHRLAELAVVTYFCDAHAPWQKGGVENAIGRLRRYLPRITNLDTLSPQDIERAVCRFNATPRPCLGYQTPEELFCLSSSVALQP